MQSFSVMERKRSMKIEKRHLADLKRCYSTSCVTLDGKPHLFFASEDPNVGCLMAPLSDPSQLKEVWKEPGGCMSMIALPDRENEFICIQEFYLKVTPSLSKLVHVKYEAGQFVLTDIVSLPYAHRFDIFHEDGKNYLVVATIARHKEGKEDWKESGQIYVGELSDDGKQVELTEIATGLYRNHGYYRGKDQKSGYFGCDQGLYFLQLDKGEFKLTKLLEGQIGEIAAIDLDGDGRQELMTIEPFHGNEIHIYHENEKGGYDRVFTYENKIDFAHSLVADTLVGVPSFIAGVRRLDAELFYVQYRDGQYQVQVIDQNVGPANLWVVHDQEADLILSSNHTANEAAIYRCTKEAVC